MAPSCTPVVHQCGRCWDRPIQRSASGPERYLRGQPTSSLILTPSGAGSLANPASRASSNLLPRLGAGLALLSAAAGEGKRQLSGSHDPIGFSSPLLPLVAGAKGKGGDLSIVDATARGRASFCRLTSFGAGPCHQVSSTVLPRGGIVTTFLSATVVRRQGQLSYVHDHKGQVTSLLQVIKREEGISPLSTPPDRRKVGKPFHICILGASSPATLATCKVALPITVAGSHVFRASSPSMLR